MLFIDNAPIDWSRWGNKKKTEAQFAKPHTWTVAPHLIKLNAYTNQLETPRLLLSTQYRSNFKYGEGEPIARHHVHYWESERPAGVGMTQIKIPLNLEIPYAGFLADLISPEQNFFHTYSPWTQDGIAYEPTSKRRIYQYEAERHALSLETEADVIMAVLQRVRETKVSKPGELIAMAKAVLASSAVQSGVRLDEQLMNAIETPDNLLKKQNHLIQLKNSLFKFAQRNPRHLKDLLKSEDAHLHRVIEHCRSRRVLNFKQENATPTTQGRWVFDDDGRKLDVCVVTIEQRPTERLFQFLSKPKKSEADASKESYALLLPVFEEQPVTA